MAPTWHERAWYMRPIAYDFDPSRSQNAFVNGDSIYRFIPGQPLCVSCGNVGHLNRSCEGEQLHPDEQRYLHRMISETQNRAKAERGLDLTRPTMAMTPGNETLERVPWTSRSRHAGRDIAEGPRSEYRPYWRPNEAPERSSSTGQDLPMERPPQDLLPGTGHLPRGYLPRTTALPRREDFDPNFIPRYSPIHQPTSSEDPSSVSIERGHRAMRFEGTYRQPHEAGPTPQYEGPSEGRDRNRETATNQNHTNVDHPLLPLSNSARAGSQHPRDNVRRSDHDQGEVGDQGAAYIIPDFKIVPDELTNPTTNPPPATVPNPPTLNPNFIPLGMGAANRMSNGEPKIVGPHPSTIRVSAPYITQSAIEKRLQPPGLDAQERNLAAAREDQFCLQGVTWLDNVRRALQLPIRTYTTACVYYHKFRLAHPTSEYSWSDAAAASLLTSCKNEDTLKKSKDILAAAYNLKQSSSHEQVGSDDPMFDGPSRAVVGIERLILESGAFDFRSRSPHHVLVKIGKSLPASQDLKAVVELAWTVLTDIHRTFAPLKHTSATLSLASLELAVHFFAATSETKTCSVSDDLQALDIGKWCTTRAEVMETLLDALDLYTHHTVATILGPKYSLDNLLQIRRALNKECSEANLPRYTSVQPPTSPDDTNGTANTLRVSNGHPTPVSPPQPGTQAPQQPLSGPYQPEPEGGGTLRFMLNPQRAVDERAQVQRYHVEEWEEYEEEIEVPIPRNRSRDRSDRHRLPDRPSDRERDGRSREFDDRRSEREGSSRAGAPPLAGRELERERLRIREREAERERTRLRERERDRRYDDRRGEDGGHGHGHGHHGHGRGGRGRHFDDRRPYDGDRRRGPRDERR